MALKNRYGDPLEIVEKYIETTVSGTVLQRNDVQGLRKFADEVVTCNQVIKQLGRTAELETVSYMRDLSAKLPWNYQDR